MSTHRARLIFKIATEDWEFEQVHRLNYKTFVEEIPQHPASPTQRLVDKFHGQNTYLICLADRKLVGMLAVRAERPFSLDQKVSDLDSFLPADRNVCEIRLLAIEKAFRGARGGQILAGILALLSRHGLALGYDLAIISGTTRQLKLYRHLGFVPFGALVGSAGAQFQPMYLTLETFEGTSRQFLRSPSADPVAPRAVNFLPGPVEVRREVRRAFEHAPESHRADCFKVDFDATREALCTLTGARHVQLLLGSGTLANDAVAAQLSLLNQPGLVLSNGEFGSRLIDQARRWQLKFDTLVYEWGKAFDLTAVAQRLDRHAKPAWLWFAHCETSTGVLNDLAALKSLAAARGVKVCVDCISSIGAVPVDLAGIHLATGASGKGLRAYPGIALVFHQHDIAPAPARLPRYLDLGYYAEKEGIPFTFSSNLLHALHAAVGHVNWDDRFTDVVALGALLRKRLSDLRLNLLGADAQTSPAVFTLALPPEIRSVEFGDAMQKAGYLLGYNSEYLRERNWIQICFLGECTRENVLSLMSALERAVDGRHAAMTATAPIS